jgi:hypothetical protein
MNLTELQLAKIETDIAMAVSSVNCVVTKAMIDRRDELRAIVGLQYDAVNRVWLPLDENAAQ